MSLSEVGLKSRLLRIIIRALPPTDQLTSRSDYGLCWTIIHQTRVLVPAQSNSLMVQKMPTAPWNSWTLILGARSGQPISKSWQDSGPRTPLLLIIARLRKSSYVMKTPIPWPRTIKISYKSNKWSYHPSCNTDHHLGSTALKKVVFGSWTKQVTRQALLTHLLMPRFSHQCSKVGPILARQAPVWT